MPCVYIAPPGSHHLRSFLPRAIAARGAARQLISLLLNSLRTLYKNCRRVASRKPLREHLAAAVRRFRWVDESREGCVMNRIAKALRVGLSLLGLAIFGSLAGAQDVPPLDKIQSQAELDKAITALDEALFDSYNKCDLEKFASYFTENVEFYHDQGGVTLGRAALTESVKKNICGKVTRELVPGTLQVFHMKGFGAIEMGVHRFHHPGHEDTEGVGEGRFVHLWQSKVGAWKITRVLSYDHHAAPK